MLLYELLVRTTLRNVARLLNVHNFMEISLNTLRQLHDNVVSKADLEDSCIEENMAMADSSSATIEASSVEEPRKSRKRKRTSSQLHELNDKPRTDCDIRLLYFSMCRVFRHLNILVLGSQNGSEGFVIEHLKAATKAPPEKSAKILGTSLLLANILLRKTFSLAEDHKGKVDRCISSSVSWWKTCLATADDSTDQPSNVCKNLKTRKDTHLAL